MKELDVEYDPLIILLSFTVAFLGSYLAVSFAEQLRIVDVKKDLRQGLYILFLMAISLGGIGIFGMHFIGMSSVKMAHPNSDKKLEVKYSSTLTLISLVAVLMFGVAGFYVASLDPLFRKSRQKLVDMFFEEAKLKSFNYARHITLFQMVRLITTKDLGHLIAGGILTGSGVCVMHYIGMLAMQYEMKMRWNVGLVILSVLIAVFASTAAFWIMFRLLSLYSRLESLRIVSALVMAIAVCGMHYTGMGAVTFYMDEDYKVDVETTFTSKSLAEKIGVSCSLLGVCALFMIAVHQQRVLISNLRRRLGDSGSSGLDGSDFSESGQIKSGSVQVKSGGHISALGSNVECGSVHFGGGHGGANRLQRGSEISASSLLSSSCHSNRNQSAHNNDHKRRLQSVKVYSELPEETSLSTSDTFQHGCGEINKHISERKMNVPSKKPPNRDDAYLPCLLDEGKLTTDTSANTVAPVEGDENV